MNQGIFQVPMSGKVAQMGTLFKGLFAGIAVSLYLMLNDLQSAWSKIVDA